MELLSRIGYAVCHQLPERTIFIDGNQLPVCARDTGIYLGSLISLIFIFISKRRRSNTIPSLPISFSFVFFFLIMGIDAITSYTGIRGTTNSIRLITGLLSGLGLPLFLYPILRDNIFESGEEISVLRNWLWFLLLLLLSFGVYLLVMHFNTNLFVLISVTTILGVCMLHYLLVCTVLSLFISRSTSFSTPAKLLIVFPVGLIILIGEFLILTKLHNLVRI